MERPEELNQEKQMKFAFMDEGGILADDGVDRDPVSGNEVPAGSMAEEVRDDVPAMLSEGEYVVPADVVRYHGIDKFEDLRDEAKMGLQRMEADGRIGGQPVEEQEEFPFPVEELEGFNEGGTVGDIYPDVMGQPFTPGQRYPSSDRFPGVGFELRNFTNPTTGKTVVIPFFNGNPMQFIPPDFLEGGASTTRGGTFDPTAGERDRQEREAELARGTGRGMSDLAYDSAIKAIQGVETGPQAKPFSEYSADDFRNYLAQRESGLGRVMDAIPVIGLLTSMQDNAAREFARKSLLEQKNIVTGQPLTFDESGILIQIAELPERQSVLSAIDNFLLGKKATPQQRFPAELGQQASGFADYVPPSAEALRTDTTVYTAPQTIVDQPPMGERKVTDAKEYLAQVEEAKGTVAEEAKKIVEKGDDYDAEKVDRESAERMKKALGFIKNPFQSARELLGAKPLEAQEMTDSTAKQIAAYNQAENTLLKEEVSMTDSQGNSLGSTTDEILGNIEKSSNINYNESTKLFEPYQVRKADGTLEPFWTIGVGQRLTQSLPVDANGVITSAPPAGQTKEQVINNFKGNVKTAFDGAKKVMEEDYGAVWGNLSAGGMSVTTQVAFQTGEEGLAGFKDANTKLVAGDIAGAKDAYLDSKWAKSDSPRRANLVVGDLAPNSTVNTIWKRTTAVAKPAEVAPLPDPLLQQETGFDPTASQPLQQTYVPPSIPTKDDILRAGGIDAYVESLPQDVDQKATGLQDLPVGVSIEADGQFTGTGGLGAVQAPRVRTPIVKRDFLDPSMSMSRREVLSDPTRFRGPSGAGIGPMSEDARLQTGLATDFNRFKEKVQTTPITAQRTADDKPITTQTEAMLADLQPKISPTIDTKPATQSRRLGLSPGAMGGRQLGMSPGAMGGRAAPPAPTPDFLEFEQDRTIPDPPKREAPKKTPPKEEQISQQEYEQRVADATRRENEKARDRADSARDSVLRQGGSVQEAFDAAQTAFTGFTPSGEFVGATDPGTEAMNRFSKGGLASKSKKTKPKKRNTKKGLGGKMAT